MAGNQVSVDIASMMAKVEVTYGSDPTPTEGISLRGRPTITVEREQVERLRVHATSGRVSHGVIDKHISFNFQCAVTPCEDADSGVSSVHPFMVGGGWAATTSGSAAGSDVQVDYAHKTTAHGSYAMHVMLYDRTNGQQIRLKLLGCRGNFGFTAGENSELLMDVAGMAKYAEWEAVASLSDPSSYGFGLKSMMVSGITHTYGGTARRITNWAWNSNWQVAPENDIRGTSNAHEILLYRDLSNPPSGSMNPVMLSSDFAASSSLMSAIRGTAGEEEAAHIVSVPGNATGETFVYTADKTQLGVQPDHVEDASVMRFGVPFMNNENTTADDIVDFTFTATTA